MANPSYHEGEHVWRDDVTFLGAVTLPDDVVGDDEFDGGSPLTAAKQQHQYGKTFSQVHGTAAVAERRAIHRARGAGSVVEVAAGSVVACVGNATITIDVRKNGTTILSAPIVLDSTNTAFVDEAGTISVSAYVAGDVFEVVQAVSAGTGTLGQGVFCEFVTREAAD